MGQTSMLDHWSSSEQTDRKQKIVSSRICNGSKWHRGASQPRAHVRYLSCYPGKRLIDHYLKYESEASLAFSKRAKCSAKCSAQGERRRCHAAQTLSLNGSMSQPRVTHHRPECQVSRLCIPTFQPDGAARRQRFACVSTSVAFSLRVLTSDSMLTASSSQPSPPSNSRAANQPFLCSKGDSRPRRTDVIFPLPASLGTQKYDRRGIRLRTAHATSTPLSLLIGISHTPSKRKAKSCLPVVTPGSSASWSCP